MGGLGCLKPGGEAAVFGDFGVLVVKGLGKMA
jgi:hypothetical protein